ncbi:MAG: Gfo/Idh/MocA family oxidoreductase [Candidatus Atribacteria bacterium]|nr:Gfo/Idh/MocA family oxidoreductase [Candidatus Atribacteria bacterium]
MAKFNVALIGCGRISTTHLRAILNHDQEIRLVSVCDLVKERAELIARKYVFFAQELGIQTEEPVSYVNYKEMLEKENIDICSLCTESGYHAKISIDCLKKGYHVLVEKPMALSLIDVDNMIKIAQEKNLKLGVCFQNRYNPTIQRLRQAVIEKRFGKVFGITARTLWNRNQDYYRKSNWRGTWALDGGCLMNQCIHNIDLLQWMAPSEIQSIYGQVRNFLHPYNETEDYASIIVHFKDGSIGNIEGTVNVYPKNMEETLTVLGEKGTVVIGGVALNKILFWNFSDQEDSLEEIQQQCNEEITNVYGNGHSRVYKDFITSIKNNSRLLIDGVEAKKSLQIILMAYQSQKENKPVLYHQDLQININDFKGKLKLN